MTSGPDHFPGLRHAYSQSSVAGQTSLLAACSTLISGEAPLWCLKDVIVTNTCPSLMTMFCAITARCGCPFELTVSPIHAHAWNAREKTTLIRDASYLCKAQHAALMTLSSRLKVIGFLVVFFLACVPAISMTFFNQNLAVGSPRLASLWSWLKRKCG